MSPFTGVAGDDTPSELTLLMGPGGGEPETLLVIGPPAGGAVVVSRSSADDWSAPPAPSREDAAALLRWIERQAASGRSLTQSLYGIRRWLRGDGLDIPSR